MELLRLIVTNDRSPLRLPQVCQRPIIYLLQRRQNESGSLVRNAHNNIFLHGKSPRATKDQSSTPRKEGCGDAAPEAFGVEESWRGGGQPAAPLPAPPAARAVPLMAAGEHCCLSAAWRDGSKQNGRDEIMCT